MKALLIGLTSLHLFTAGYTIDAVTSKQQEYVHIETYQQDLTNDGHMESITINGQLLSAVSAYYREITLEITGNNNQWPRSLKGGYEPSIEFININHDGVNELFYQSLDKPGGHPHDQHLYTFNQQQLTEIPLPKPVYIEGEFQDNFQVQIKLSPLGRVKPVHVDVRNQAIKYTKHGIYNHQGQVIRQQRIIVQPISFYEPIQTNDKNGHHLKSHQNIYGADQTDKIGVVETIWRYKNNQWIAVKTTVNPI